MKLVAKLRLPIFAPKSGRIQHKMPLFHANKKFVGEILAVFVSTYHRM